MYSGDSSVTRSDGACRRMHSGTAERGETTTRGMIGLGVNRSAAKAGLQFWGGKARGGGALARESSIALKKQVLRVTGRERHELGLSKLGRGRPEISLRFVCGESRQLRCLMIGRVRVCPFEDRLEIGGYRRWQSEPEVDGA